MSYSYQVSENLIIAGYGYDDSRRLTLPLPVPGEEVRRLRRESLPILSDCHSPNEEKDLGACQIDAENSALYLNLPENIVERIKAQMYGNSIVPSSLMSHFLFMITPRFFVAFSKKYWQSRTTEVITQQGMAPQVIVASHRAWIRLILQSICVAAVSERLLSDAIYADFVGIAMGKGILQSLAACLTACLVKKVYNCIIGPL